MITLKLVMTTSKYVIFYSKFADHFAQNNYVVHLIDLRGFGYSGGSRTNEPLKEVLSDIENLLRFCCENALETFILAQGLGAMFVNALLQENCQLPISGVIFLSPVLKF